jgi:hypothetical protein
MSATADDAPHPDQDEIHRQYDATREAGLRHRADPEFQERVRAAIAHLDSVPPVPTMTQAEFSERYPTKK